MPGTKRTTRILLLAALAVVAAAILSFPWDGRETSTDAAAAPAERDDAASARPEPDEIVLSAPQALSGPAAAQATSERAPPPKPVVSPRLAGTIEVHPTLGQFAPWITYDPLAATRLESESGRVFRPVACDGPMYACCFEDVPPGRYRVVVEAPIFRIFTSVVVEPGAVVFPILRGSASVAVTVIDSDGSAVEDYALEVQGDAAVGHRPKALRTASDPGAPKDGVYAVPPGDWTFTMRVAERGTESATVLDLRAGETRALDFVLERPTRIAGRLVDARGDSLRRSETVELHARSSDPPPQARLTLPRAASASTWGATTVVSTLSSPDGDFSFVDVLPGPYSLRASVAPGLEAAFDLELEPGGRLEGLELRLPPCAYLSGIATGPPGARLDEVQLRLSRRDGSGSGDIETLRKTLRGEDPLLARCGVDGAYRLGPVAPGAYTLSLAFPSFFQLDASISFGIRGRGQRLEQALLELELELGENRRDLDLAALWPGSLDVETLIAGLPARGALVELRVEDGGAPLVAVAGDDGVARFATAPSGSLLVTVRPPEGTWHYRLPQPVLVEPASRAVARADVPLHEGTLRVSHADGTPLASTRFALGVAVDSHGFTSWSVSTDAEGLAVLRLPPGRYIVGAEWAGQEQRELQWSELGPTPGEVVLEEP